MATVNELKASHEAEMLKDILLEAIKTKNPNIISFAYRSIFPIYQFILIEASEPIDVDLVVLLQQQVVN